MSLSLYTVIAEGVKIESGSNGKAAAGTMHSAMHGQLGAQVALLQSPILPAVSSSYLKTRNFRGLPVDKPHTCSLWLKALLHFAFISVD